MKTILAALLTVLLLLPVSAFGDIQTITHTVKQPFGGSQSPDDARISAVAKAKREALELAGTYIESLTVVKSYQVDKDEILALSAGVLKAEVVSQKNYASEDAFGIDVVVKVVVDTSVLEERVKKLLQDRTHLTQLKDTQKREKELLQKIVQLEQENRKLTANKQSTAKLKKEFQQASQGLTAMDWFYKAFALWADGKYTDPKKALEYLNEAIRLKPDFVFAYQLRADAYVQLGEHQRAVQDYDTAINLIPDLVEAYNNRGATYAILDQHQKAIQDYDTAIRLKPDDAVAYSNRGNSSAQLGQHQRAVQDYDTAIRLKPDYAEAYTKRGHSYVDLGQHQRAFQDYDTAIRLKPDYAKGYMHRGNAYKKLGQHQRAIQDYDTAIRLKPDDAAVYMFRGIAYEKLGQHQRAIQDCDTAIRLKPDYPNYYNFRGFIYFSSGNDREGCRSFIKACNLGDCDAYEVAKQGGLCQ
jgi:tetratricopeptide (TPR) repeat protein